MFSLEQTLDLWQNFSSHTNIKFGELLVSLFKILFKTNKVSGAISESFAILEDQQITQGNNLSYFNFLL